MNPYPLHTEKDTWLPVHKYVLELSVNFVCPDSPYPLSICGPRTPESTKPTYYIPPIPRYLPLRPR